MPALDFPDDGHEWIAGRYRIISRLGAGGMGTAYRAWDERDGVPVVIKIPKKLFLDDPKFAERFRREIRLLQGLSHPHIVPITDVGEHEGLPFVVMRFLPGGSLSNRRLRDEHGKVRPNPPGMLHLWLPAIAEALDHVHAQGVVHRDVKPANIFFDAFWGAYLGDFGIAKIVEESDAFHKEHTLTAAHMGIGTQEYMSPEQFTPKAAIDGRADQYALAVTVYEMLAGPRPFTGATSNLIVEVLTHPAPLVTDVVRDLPASVAAAVRRGLAKNPAERFATCREFAAAVLRDVPPLEDEVDLARLLCPNPKCASILKLPTSAAGRKGKCPRCQTEMKVADDLGALWLLDEARRQRKARSMGDRTEETAGVIVAEEGAIEIFTPVSSTTPIEKAARKHARPSPLRVAGGLTLPLIGVLAVGFAIALLVTSLRSTPKRSAKVAKSAKAEGSSTRQREDPKPDKPIRVVRAPPDELVDKTLVAWVRLRNLTQRAGSALTIESLGNQFDGIVFGEMSPGRWYVGSDYGSRSTPDPGSVAPEQEAAGRMLCMAIVYEGNQVTMYRDGQVYEEHPIKSPFSFRRMESRVLFGLRHTTAADHACLAADIDDARIYGRALTAEEVGALQPNVISGEQPVAWWNFNDGSVRDAYECYQEATEKNCMVRDGRLILNGEGSYVVCVPRRASADKPPREVEDAGGPSPLDQLRAIEPREVPAPVPIEGRSIE